MAADVVYDSRTINSQIRKLVSMGKVVKIEGLTGQHSIAVGISQGKTRIAGVGGDYFGAFNAGGRLTLDGPAGRYVGDSMSGGEIIVSSHVAAGAGVYMSGGTLVVKGNAGDRVGINMRGGICVVDGYAGSFVGEYMQGGTLIIVGNAGAHLGQWMIGGEIYVGGTITNTGKNTETTDATGEEVEAVVKFLKANGIEGVTTLRKIVPESTRPFFASEEEFAEPELDVEEGDEEIIDVSEVASVVDPDVAPVAEGAVIKVDEDAEDEEEDDQLRKTMDLEHKLAEIRDKREKLMASMKRTQEAD